MKPPPDSTHAPHRAAPRTASPAVIPKSVPAPCATRRRHARSPRRAAHHPPRVSPAASAAAARSARQAARKRAATWAAAPRGPAVASQTSSARVAVNAAARRAACARSSCVDVCRRGGEAVGEGEERGGGEAKGRSGAGEERENWEGGLRGLLANFLINRRAVHACGQQRGPQRSRRSGVLVIERAVGSPRRDNPPRCPPPGSDEAAGAGRGGTFLERRPHRHPQGSRPRLHSQTLTCSWFGGAAAAGASRRIGPRPRRWLLERLGNTCV
jgi:hypothetical protein